MELSRVEIIASEAKVIELKDSLSRFGITGMTVFQVLGCGVQNGTLEYEIDTYETPNLLPKQMVMLILPTKDLERFIKFVKEELYTGHIGDGKIFISDISNVIRVRTGEEGYDAVTGKK
ncbi:nitrogen regulatory protein P-II family [Clostridium sp. DSM 8431]|uniref:P-II family nitrogen regulator n=1 Tax=Clostridium sp. DSM 8431 TaxID=1761781 RepID=UPI0008E1F785|nr:P-II family nitrogen regulator [Clostridium sp. DSM 8431]SFU53223.1 nitrogen regulatory protein P-II family [Clostridium sp. DSM 8431]